MGGYPISSLLNQIAFENKADLMNFLKENDIKLDNEENKVLLKESSESLNNSKSLNVKFAHD